MIKKRDVHLLAFSEFDRDVWCVAITALFKKIKSKFPDQDIDTNVLTTRGKPYIPGKTES